MSAVVFEDQVEIPLGIRSLRDFRRWMRSSAFPKSGRIDYICGDIEVDQSARDFFSHGGPKTALVVTLGKLNFQRKLGYLLLDKARVVSDPVRLSAEPDLMFVSRARLENKQTKFAKGTDSYLEVEGGPDLIVEIVSPSSVGKDMVRLPAAYFTAGVLEYWLIDARQDDALRFQIYRRGKTELRRVRADAEGFQKSNVFGRSIRLTRERDRLGYWEFELQLR